MKTNQNCSTVLMPDSISRSAFLKSASRPVLLLAKSYHIVHVLCRGWMAADAVLLSRTRRWCSDEPVRDDEETRLLGGVGMCAAAGCGVKSLRLPELRWRCMVIMGPGTLDDKGGALNLLKPELEDERERRSFPRSLSVHG